MEHLLLFFRRESTTVIPDLQHHGVGLTVAGKPDDPLSCRGCRHRLITVLDQVDQDLQEFALLDPYPGNGLEIQLHLDLNATLPLAT